MEKKSGSFSSQFNALSRQVEKLCSHDSSNKEEFLKQSEELFGKVFNSIPGLATLWQKNSRNKIILLMANEGSYIESKGKIAELIGTDVNEFFSGDTEPVQYITGAMNTGEQYHVVMKSKLQTTGKTKWFYQDYVRVTKNLVLNVSQDVTERECAREELQKYKEELHHLIQHRETVREEERAEIARAIHDDLGQSLTALKIDLSILRNEFVPSNRSIHEKIDAMSAMIDSTIRKIQSLGLELRPGILDDLGLAAAVEWLTEEIQKRTNITFKLNIYPEEISLDENLSVNIFRMIQEALTNVVRHSMATRVNISLESTGQEVRIQIKDNGIGIAEDKIRNLNSLGLIGIRERARFWNGTVNITGEKNKGTEVLIKLKINREKTL